MRPIFAEIFSYLVYKIARTERERVSDYSELATIKEDSGDWTDVCAGVEALRTVSCVEEKRLAFLNQAKLVA